MNYDVLKLIISINMVLYVGNIIYSKLNITTLLALYNPFDPFFNFSQFVSYMFIHSIYIFLHIIFNMFILWICGIHINSVHGNFKFIIIYFYSGVTVGLLQNMLNILLIYNYTGRFNLYNISHISICISDIQRINLQYSMYSPIIGSSGAIASIIGSFTTIKSKIFIINFILYNVISFFKKNTGISYLSHFSGLLLATIFPFF